LGVSVWKPLFYCLSFFLLSSLFPSEFRLLNSGFLFIVSYPNGPIPVGGLADLYLLPNIFYTNHWYIKMRFKLIAVIFCGFFLTTALAQVSIRIPEIHSPAGTHLVIPIMIDSAGGATAIQFTFSYDPADLLILSENSIFAEADSTDHGIRTSLIDGRLSIAIFSPSLSQFRQAGGVLVQILAETDPDLDIGSEITLSLSDIYASDPNGNQLSVSAETAHIQISDELGSPLPGQNELVFPQVANGGGYFTTIILVNSHDAPAAAQLDFYLTGNKPFDVVLDDGTSGSSLEFSIKEKGCAVFRTDGSGELNVGYARLHTSVPLSGTIIFTVRNEDEIITEAGVPPSPLINHFELPVLYEENAYDTGIAVFNVNDFEVSLDLKVRQNTGEVLFSKTDILDAYQHLPLFTTQLFPELSELESFEGVIEVNSNHSVAVVALKLTGQVLTTFPVLVPESN